MHDFRKSVFQAALWLRDISQETFSWSAGKHRLFHTCRRAYLIRYYIAQGGWDASASQIARKAFTEKYLRTFPAWLTELLTESLSDTLLQLRSVPEHKRKEELIRTLKLRLSHRIFLAETFLMERKDLTDPKKLSFFDLYYRTGRFSSGREILAQSKQFFRDFFACFPSSSLLERILRTDVLAWRVPPGFLLMKCKSIPVYLRPRIYALAGDGVTALSFALFPSEEDRPKVSYSSSEPSAESLADSLFASYASGRFNTEKVATFIFTLCGRDVEEDAFLPSPAPESLILESAAEMLAHLPSSRASLEDFPPSPEVSRCARCPFQGTCSYLEC